MIGLIRVVSGLNDEQLHSHARAIAGFVDDDIVTRAIPDQLTGVHDDETHARAVPKIVELGRQFAAEGASLIIISCAADPGLDELRATVGIPVIGAGSAGASLALAAGGKVGVLGITPEVPDPVIKTLGDFLVADRVPKGVTCTLDLLQPATYANALAAADELKSAGAQSILFACTGLTTIGLAADVFSRTGLPVVDAVKAVGALAGVIVSATRN